MHPLIKLQQCDGTGSLNTFLTKFQCMASYLWWDEEDMFHHLCPSLEGTVGQILWDISPHVTVADIIHLLLTKFGTQLQAERFNVELHVRRRAPWESPQQLYQDIGCLVTLAYPSAGASLVTHVGKEAFIAALSDGKLQLEVLKREVGGV